MSETKTVWHPVKVVPYDRAKHSDHFDLFDDDLHIVWEGDLPEENINVLVSFWSNDGSYGVGISCLIRDDGLCWFEEFDDKVFAWAELPKPYQPEGAEK